MSNLSQFLGGASSSSSSGGGGGGNSTFSTDPFERAAWYVWTANDTSNRAYITYNHYNRPLTSWRNSGNYPNMDSTHGYETMNNNSGVMTTNSNSSSNTRSYGSSSVSGGGGDIGSLTPSGWAGFMGGHANEHYRHITSANNNSCCWVGNTDPQRRIYRRGQHTWAGGRAGMEGSSYNTHSDVWICRGFAKQSRNGWYFGSSVSSTNRFGWSTAANQSRGCMGYNQRIKVMVFVENVSSHMRWHWYKDVPPPHPGVDWNWWRQNVKESNHRWTDVPYSIYNNEDRYHHTVTVCDNGQVYCTYGKPHTGFWIQAINFTNETYGQDTDCGYTYRHHLDQYGVENTTDVNAQMGSMQSTTCYGIDQDEDHGQQFMITNDGRYVLCMWPYYYYGSGMKMYMIDSVTGEYRKGWRNNTSESVCVVPIGANDFIFNVNENADSDYRLHIGRHSMEENFHAYKLDNYGQGGNSIKYGPYDGGTLEHNFNKGYGFFDTQYHSTNYPRIYPVVPGALTIAEVEAYRGPITNNWSTPQNTGHTYSDQATWSNVNPPESGW